MSNTTWVLVGVAVLLAAFIVARPLRAWRHFRGLRLVNCPENRRPAAVHVDAWHAAITGLRRPDLRLSSCSRWPEKRGCGEECLREIEDAPQDCLVRNILAAWYRGRSCAWCGKPFREILWETASPGLLRPDGVSLAWNDVSVDRLTETMSTALPVCYACHMANQFVREHPEMVVDRSNCGPFPGRGPGL